jgi:hypothetical protein
MIRNLDGDFTGQCQLVEDALAQLIYEAVLEEREACAKVAESHDWSYDEEPVAMRAIAAAIRARR